jgi:methylmalonyl-CoA mutase
MKKKSYNPKEPLRFVTATSLFDGHDASINIMRRILQDQGAEVIHLGHNRSVTEIVNAAIQEGAHAVAVSSYQGGHLEFFKYLVDLLRERGCPYVRVFGGGGGVIVPDEIRELEEYGVSKIYSPEDGKAMGLAGMIRHMMDMSKDVHIPEVPMDSKLIASKDPVVMGRLISMAERSRMKDDGSFAPMRAFLRQMSPSSPVIGVTGTGGSGKSSFIDEFIRRFLARQTDRTVAVISVDPTRSRSGGALLGDRIRMNSIEDGRVFMRSMATRGSANELSDAVDDAIVSAGAAGYDLVIVETSGIGQGDTAVAKVSDLSVYVMTAEFGAPSQLEKIDMLDFADVVVINKFEQERSMDALRHVRKQFQRNRGIFDAHLEDMPVFGTVASRYDDPGMDRAFAGMINLLADKGFAGFTRMDMPEVVYEQARGSAVSSSRRLYLSEVVKAVRTYHDRTREIARKISTLGAMERLASDEKNSGALGSVQKRIAQVRKEIPREDCRLVDSWGDLARRYRAKTFTYSVRDRKIQMPLVRESLAGLPIPKIALPSFSDKGDLYTWLRKENVPGSFPFTAGVFPFKRNWEDPKRQFAGEGSPERTNRRFHYLCRHDEAKRLSTAFDSVTLYGQDPDERPDIFGKIGESGVSVCTLDDMKKLYAGFDLCSPTTSVSMTINGPAPIMTAMFFNTAIDQQVELFEKHNGRKPSGQERASIVERVLRTVRGTVQADILKEDQGQNTCIFSTEFALRMMGDIQEYFIERAVENFYSVSISGYHIAEAGANPITQLAFTMANAFTYVEYYLARGMRIDDFVRNFSFFFSSGMDPEYSVLGRVARRIWAVAMRDMYGADESSQRLKYHIQTSGRSLHAIEIQFNDIRTTLQALTALADNCNSLHTNAYDEAITTPTEESVRRAMAIQMIIMREFGQSMNENPLQGSFFMEWLTDAVEDAVLKEFERLSDRGGVLGAMETQYQRGRIQDESLHYEHLKHSGALPIIGVNTFENPEAHIQEGATAGCCIPLTRAGYDEKRSQLENCRRFQKRHARKAGPALERLKETALSGGNIFAELMETVRVASLGQITQALYEVGGRYRRNM